MKCKKKKSVLPHLVVNVQTGIIISETLIVIALFVLKEILFMRLRPLETS